MSKKGREEAEWPIDPHFAERLQARLHEVLGDISARERNRRVGGALEFLQCCAISDAPPLAPSPMIDAVWHEMIMFTADYRELCHSMGVAFIDHEPLNGTEPNAPTVVDTISFMEQRGFQPPADLWRSAESAKCCSGHISF